MKKSILFFLVASLLSCTVLSSCSDLTESSQNSSEESSQNYEESSSIVVEKKDDGNLTDEQKEALEGIIETYSEQVTFNSSNDSILSSDIADGKSLLLITDSVEDEYSAMISETFITAAKQAGFTNVISYDSDGTTDSYITALELAISDGYDCVAFFGDIDKDELGTEIEIVQSHGIPVFSAGNSQEGVKEAYVDGSVGWDYTKAGELLIDWISYQQDGQVNALVITCSDDNTSSYAYEGFAEAFNEYVTQGYCTEVTALSSEIGSDLKSKIQTALEKDSNLNCVIVLDEDLISDTVSAIKAEGLTGELLVAATGGTPESFTELENGNLDMIAAGSYEAVAYALADYCVRGLSESGVPETEDLPIRIFTQETIESETVSTDETEGEEGTIQFYNYAFQSIFSEGYKELWGVES